MIRMSDYISNLLKLLLLLNYYYSYKRILQHGNTLTPGYTSSVGVQHGKHTNTRIYRNRGRPAWKYTLTQYRHNNLINVPSKTRESAIVFGSRTIGHEFC